MRTPVNMVTKVINATQTEEKARKSSRQVSPPSLKSFPKSNKTLIDDNPVIVRTVVAESITDKMPDTTTSWRENVENSKINKIKALESNQDQVLIPFTQENPNYTHASFMAISSTRSTEEVDIADGENVTDDPLMKENDTNTFAVTFNTGMLESRSFVLEESKNVISETTKTDETTSFTTLVSKIRGDTFSFTTQTSRGDSLPDELTSTESDLSFDSKLVLDNNAQSSNIQNKSENLIIQLLPESSLSQLNISENINNDVNKLDNSHISQSNASLAPKILPDAENQNDVIQKIEDIVLSELQPASIRRKHRVPKEFECRR